MRVTGIPSPGNWAEFRRQQINHALAEFGMYTDVVGDLDPEVGGGVCTNHGRGVARMTRGVAAATAGWWIANAAKYAELSAGDPDCFGCSVADNLKQIHDLADGGILSDWGIDISGTTAGLEILPCDAAAGIWAATNRIALALDSKSMTAGDWNTFWEHVPGAASDTFKSIGYYTGLMAAGTAKAVGGAAAAGLLGFIGGLGPIFWVGLGLVLYQMGKK